ncbi:hypothetical protein [Streptomyces sp. NBC_01198]|uniref:hypothetical protein n=1 Tax=Streptomyces sp. NBC_01198 TaxID=2903769 RepID=UPI002E11CD7F|nr:hypothetical protein OG702_31955 [Streptomyces sp. NBC_01198]
MVDFEAPQGLIHVHVDVDAEDCYIDAAPGYSPSIMGQVLRHVRSIGLEPIDDGYGEPELLPDGSVRIYLTETSERPSVAGLATLATTPILSRVAVTA